MCQPALFFRRNLDQNKRMRSWIDSAQRCDTIDDRKKGGLTAANVLHI